MCMQVLNLQTYSSIQVSHIKVLFCFVFDSFPMWHYRILIEFPVLCSFPLLGIYFIYSSVFMSSPFMCVCSVISDSLRPHRLQLTRLLCLQDFPGKSTGVGCHFHLQGIFPTQRSNPHLLHLPALSGGFFFFFFFNHWCHSFIPCCPPLPLCSGNRKFVLYICDSTSVLYISSFVPC